MHYSCFGSYFNTFVELWLLPWASLGFASDVNLLSNCMWDQFSLSVQTKSTIDDVHQPNKAQIC
jgi:hypothetical protein